MRHMRQMETECRGLNRCSQAWSGTIVFKVAAGTRSRICRVAGPQPPRSPVFPKSFPIWWHGSRCEAHHATVGSRQFGLPCRASWVRTYHTLLSYFTGSSRRNTSGAVRVMGGNVGDTVGFGTHLQAYRFAPDGHLKPDQGIIALLKYRACIWPGIQVRESAA